jgi:alpha-galactosidase
METPSIPQMAPQDSIMASPAEVQAMQGWAGTAFADIASPVAVPITVRRQDHSTLHFGRSCLGTPLRIGDEHYAHGLGTHANSELLVAVPAGARAFAAAVGIDRNYDTNGQRGSVEFSIECGGREIFHSPVLRGSDGPLPVRVDLPAGTTELVLKVDTTPDGAGWDQADWADARFLLADGSAKYLDEGRVDSLLPVPVPPFSFVYGGKPSSEFLDSWPRTVTTTEGVHTVCWTDPHSGLEVKVVARTFKDYPATDWVLHFTNTGPADTPIIEQIQALDVRLRTDAARRLLTIHQLEGDACGDKSFTPFATTLKAKQSYRLASTGGRSSNTTAFPFFNLEFEEQGLLVAVGWSGQWAASFTRDDSGTTRLAAGMEQTHLLLHPGESIRTPRILAMAWQGSREDAHNRWRRLLLFHYLPKQEDRPARMPFALQCFDRYSWTRAEWATEQGQVTAVDTTASLGFSHHWLDAAWFPGGFPHGVGNWETKPAEFRASSSSSGSNRNGSPRGRASPRNTPNSSSVARKADSTS